MLNDYIAWIKSSALPTWAERGFDTATGRFSERLDRWAQPVPVPHRAMVQARQIFVFAHAAECGWSTRGGELAEAAMTSLVRDFGTSSGDESSFAFSIDPASHAIVSPARDAYSHAFILFSIAALFRLNGDRRLLDLADRTICFIERSLEDPIYGGLFDALPASAEKRQNPHMHLLEAYLFLERAAPGRGYLGRAAKLIALFTQRFFANGRLREYFAGDWSVPDRAVWEPGHHFEWVWLLAEYTALSGEDTSPWGEALYASAIARGIAPRGLIVDEISAAGDLVLKTSHRLWPHTEAIKAAAIRHAAGDVSAFGFADAMATSLLNAFLDQPFAGGWIDQIDAEGAPLVDYVPASSLYHLVLAGSVAAKGFAAPPAPGKAKQ